MTGNKNRALAYMLKAYGIIDGNIEEILDMYFKACSIRLSCIELANMAFVLVITAFTLLNINLSSAKNMQDMSM